MTAWSSKVEQEITNPDHFLTYRDKDWNQVALDLTRLETRNGGWIGSSSSFLAWSADQ